jgi:hypothetical protein
MAVSWQGISVPERGQVTRSMIVKYELHEVVMLTLVLNVPDAPQVLYSAEFTLSGRVETNMRADRISVYVVVDNDFSRIDRVVSESEANSEFSFFFATSHHTSNSSCRRVAFYAVNLYGDVSSPQFFPPKFTLTGELKDTVFDATGLGIGACFLGVIIILVIVGLCMNCWRKRKRAAWSADSGSLGEVAV